MKTTYYKSTSSRRPEPVPSSPSVLDELSLTRAQVHILSGRDRNRLFRFLLRWGHVDALHAFLDALITGSSPSVSLLDWRAKAFLAQGRPSDALTVMQERLERSTSLAARALLARIHLARDDGEAALQVARALVQERENRAMYWALLAEVELARGDMDGALAACRRLGELRPQGRAYLLGMVSLYQARDDWVTASGYAVRLQRTADAEHPLTVAYLRQLREYFRASGEEIRVADLEAELARRHVAELAELRAALSPTPRVRPAPVPVSRPVPPAELPPAEFPPTFDHVPVSEAERARIATAVQRLFGFESFLPGQLETIACVLRGEDVLTILPTGGGKSLCYQLPALLAERGTTLVISPLVALMKDQIDSLPAALRCRATNIDYSLDWDVRRRRMGQAADGAFRLVYAAPERLRQPPFLHALRRAGVDRLVIDEAHCVSVWGHDFRPDYLTIGQARRALGDPPLLAMTATAPPRVRRDIIRHLGDASAGRDLRIVAGDVTRPNLQLEVFHARSTDEKLRRLLTFCQAEPGSGIVYAGTRARCEKLAALLRTRGVVAGHYHAGIVDRAEVQDAFMAGHIRVVVATIAFGLGIDKPDIRSIVHFVPSNSLEAYYQEAGRAGRDGLPARCLLMYAASDRARLTRHARRDTLPVGFLRAVYAAVKRRLDEHLSGRVAAADLERDMQSDNTRVRVGLSLLEQVGLLRRGPDLPRAAVVCLTISDLPAAAPELAAFCRAARLRPEQPLRLDLADVARRADLPLDGIERYVLEWADAGWLNYRPAGRDLLLELLPPPTDAAERIGTLLEQYETVQVQRVDEIMAYAQTRRCRHGHINAYLGGRMIEQCGACDNCVDIRPRLRGSSKESPKKDAAGLDMDEALFETLRAWRLEQARAQGVPAFVIFHDSHLRAIAAHRPGTLEALSELKGIGPRKLENYGASVIELVRQHLEGGIGDPQTQD
jgi:ATP-dependent DNA helicase RecQ